MLVPPIARRSLILNLIVIKIVMKCVLGQHDDSRKKANNLLPK